MKITDIVPWVGAAAGSITAASAAVAVWRHFFSVELPINMSVADTLLGENDAGESISQNYCVRNVGELDIQIEDFILEQKRWPRWANVRDSVQPVEGMPRRLAPNATMNVLISIPRSAPGKYRVQVREFGSQRRATFMLSEFARGVAVGGAP